MKKQTVLGLLIITAGVVALLANTNVGSTRAIVQDWWPLTVIVAGAYMLWVNARNYVWPLIVMGFGTVMLLNTLDVADVNVGALIFPALLVGVGLSIIYTAQSSQRKITETKGSDSVTAIMGGSTSKNTSDDYTGGTVTAIMGGVEFDMSKAIIKKQAVLGVSIVMGGLELRVAEDVKIVNRTQSLLGGLEDKTSTTAKTGPTLVIEGLVLMGGIEIKR